MAFGAFTFEGLAGVVPMTYRDSPRTRSPEELVDMVAKGDPNAWGELYLLMRSGLVQYGLRCGAGAGDVERIVDNALDEAQVAILAGRFDISKNRAKQPVKSWLMGFTRNYARKFYTKHPRTVSLPESADELFAAKTDEGGATRTNDALQEICKQVVATLPDDDDVQLIHMLILERRTHREAAAILGISESNSRQRLHRLIATCREEAKRLCRERRLDVPSDVPADTAEKKDET